MDGGYHQRIKEEKRAAVVRAAMELFLEQGYERTSLQQAQGAAKPLHVWPGESAQEMARNFDQLLERVMRTARLGEFA